MANVLGMREIVGADLKLDIAEAMRVVDIDPHSCVHLGRINADDQFEVVGLG